MESVAAFAWNGWQASSGISGNLGLEYALFPQSHKVGVGPFISVSVADTDGGDPFGAYGVGLMMGFKDKKGSGSWNIGFGYFVDTKAKKFRPGIEAGDTTTEQNTDDLLVEHDQGGVMLIVSTSWD